MLLSTGVMSGLCLMAGTMIEKFEKLLENSELYIFNQWLDYSCRVSPSIT